MRSVQSAISPGPQSGRSAPEEGSVVSSGTEVEDLLAQLSQAQSDLAQAQTALASAQAQVAADAATIANLQGQVASLQAQVASLQQQLQQCQAGDVPQPVGDLGAGGWNFFYPGPGLGWNNFMTGYTYNGLTGVHRFTTTYTTQSVYNLYQISTTSLDVQNYSPRWWKAATYADGSAVKIGDRFNLQVEIEGVSSTMTSSQVGVTVAVLEKGDGLLHRESNMIGIGLTAERISSTVRGWVCRVINGATSAFSPVGVPSSANLNYSTEGVAIMSTWDKFKIGAYAATDRSTAPTIGTPTPIVETDLTSIRYEGNQVYWKGAIGTPLYVAVIFHRTPNSPVAGVTEYAKINYLFEKW